MTDRRGVLALAGLAALPLPPWAKQQWDAVVDPGKGDTLGAALAKATGKPFRILVRPGVLVEKLTIATPNIMIIGSGPESVLSYGANAGAKRPDGGNWGTGGSGTLTINAPGTTLRNLTIRNSFDYIAARRDPAGNGAQAVALMIGRDADRTNVERCVLEGYQDTFYLQARSRIAHCRIVGGVDFLRRSGGVVRPLHDRHPRSAGGGEPWLPRRAEHARGAEVRLRLLALPAGARARRARSFDLARPAVARGRQYGAVGRRGVPGLLDGRAYPP